MWRHTIKVLASPIRHFLRFSSRELRIFNSGAANSEKNSTVLLNNANNIGKRFFFSPKRGKSEDEVKEIIVRVCKEFEKIPKDKFTMESKFIEDFGLDSLDQVELIMAIEDEFEFEIPVQESEKMKTPNDIINYINNYMKNFTSVTI